MEKTLSSRQLMTLTFVSMLSPFLRLIPGSVTAVSGSAAWVSTALAIIPAALLSAALIGLLNRFPKGTGLGEAVLRSLGPFPGALLLSLWTLWLICHSAFLLRSGADRFIATIYPDSKPLFFILITLAICTVAATGPFKALARTTEIFRPLLLFVILLVLLFSLGKVEPTFLLPVTENQSGEIIKGIPLAVEPVSVALVNAAFLTKFLRPENKNAHHWIWLIAVIILGVVFCAVCIGCLGETVTAALAYPFFVMARDLSIISGVERIEALVVGLWLLPDFVLVTAELMISADNLQMITGQLQSKQWKNGGILAGAVLSGVAAYYIAPDPQSLLQWSDKIIPAIHLLWAYGVIPLLLLIGGLRKKF